MTELKYQILNIIEGLYTDGSCIVASGIKHLSAKQATNLCPNFKNQYL